MWSHTTSLSWQPTLEMPCVCLLCAGFRGGLTYPLGFYVDARKQSFGLSGWKNSSSHTEPYPSRLFCSKQTNKQTLKRSPISACRLNARHYYIKRTWLSWKYFNYVLLNNYINFTQLDTNSVNIFFLSITKQFPGNVRDRFLSLWLS